MGSKFIDIVIAIAMAYFAYVKFTEGKMGLFALFLALFILNIITAVVKHNMAKREQEKSV